MDEELKTLLFKQNELIEKQNSILATGFEILARYADIMSRLECKRQSGGLSFEKIYQKSCDETGLIFQDVYSQHVHED